MSGAGSPGATVVDASGLSLAIVATRWHREITDALVARGTAAAIACGVPEPLVVRVAGAIELPVVAAELACHQDAVACLGVVIRGGTPHATAAAVPRATSESVISRCQRVATMARLSPDASTTAAPGLPAPLTPTLLGAALLWPALGRAPRSVRHHRDPGSDGRACPAW